MTTRTITLNAAQARAVLVGLASSADERRALAVGVLADALLADERPAPFIVVNAAAPAPSAAVEGDDEDERRRAAVVEGDDERARRHAAVVEAACGLVDYWGTAAPPAPATRAVRAAVEALREYAPAVVAAPADDEPAPPVGPSVRDELHDLAPLPWRQGTSKSALCDADNRYLGRVIMDNAPIALDERVVELLVALVNGPDGTVRQTVAQRAADDLRRKRERDVLDAARAWRGTGTSGPPTSRLMAAVDRLAALDKATGGAA